MSIKPMSGDDVSPRDQSRDSDEGLEDMTTQESECSSPRKGYVPSDFKIMKEIGEGSFGRVYICKRVSDKKTFAIKMVDKHHIIKVTFILTNRTKR